MYSRVKGCDGWVIAGGDRQLPGNDWWLTRGVNRWLVIKNFVFGGNYFARGEFVLYINHSGNVYRNGVHIHRKCTKLISVNERKFH